MPRVVSFSRLCMDLLVICFHACHIVNFLVGDLDHVDSHLNWKNNMSLPLIAKKIEEKNGKPIAFIVFI